MLEKNKPNITGDHKGLYVMLNVEVLERQGSLEGYVFSYLW